MTRLSPSLLLVLLCGRTVGAFAPSSSFGVVRSHHAVARHMTAAETASTTTEAVSFIDTELRGAAMKLHTRAQAPREGQAEVVATPAAAPYVTTHADYLRFLVDSQHVYQAFEEVVGSKDELKAFRNTGLERVAVLEEDIAWMTDAFDLERPAVGSLGQDYAALLRDETLSTPALVCHFYNFYFAHTAGGRMIGKKMSSLLLEGKTLAFYTWEGKLNDIKASVKANIEAMAASWTEEERAACVAATPTVFQKAGSINKYLAGAAGN